MWLQASADGNTEKIEILLAMGVEVNAGGHGPRRTEITLIPLTSRLTLLTQTLSLTLNPSPAVILTLTLNVTLPLVLTPALYPSIWIM